MSHRPLIALTCLAATLFAGASAACAEAVVLQASGPSAGAYAQGAVLRDTDQVSLIAGDTMRLLVEGQTVILHGPYKGPPRSADVAADSMPAWDGMLRAKPRTRGAAVRGVPLGLATTAPPKE